MTKRLLIICYFAISNLITYGQSNDLKQKWQLLDFENDNIYGISGFKAENSILNSRKPKQNITVAVIDCGVEVEHTYLKQFIWKNEKEVANNGIDDDNNGYIDDINGWNFVGNVKFSCDEYMRDYILLKSKFEKIKDSTLIKRHPQYNEYKKALEKKNEDFIDLENAITYFTEYKNDYRSLIRYYKENLKLNNVDYLLFKANPINKEQDSSLYENYSKRLNFLLKSPDSLHFNLNNKLTECVDILKELEEEKEFMNTLIATSDPYYYFHKENIFPENFNQKFYGNKNISSKFTHGTSCAGFIADYNYLCKSDNIKIMPIKIIIYTNQEQTDKDLFYAIKYAVDNGAKIISMSFSNATCLNKKLMNKAFIYAQQKGAIIIHSAGNLGINIDSTIRYPTSQLISGKRIDNTIRVGASSKLTTNLACSFSNYGKKQVDVFAPGDSLQYIAINNKFNNNGEGTSFATPIVAGLAASIWSYYPKLNYKQIIYCIEKSAIPIEIEIGKPNSSEKIKFTQLSKTGGIINMFNAFRIAEDISKGK